MHMVVDPNDLILSDVGKVLHCASLASTSRTLKYHSIVADCYHSSELLKEALERFGSNEIFLIEVSIWVHTLRNDELFHANVAIR